MKKLLMPLILSIAVVGCAERPKKSGDAKKRDEAMEAAMAERTKWLGQHADSLIDELGEPAQIVNATQLGGPGSVALVYTDQPNNNGCIDAYVIVQETGEVLKYFCR
jgi:hypothetical protein